MWVQFRKALKNVLNFAWVLNSAAVKHMLRYFVGIPAKFTVKMTLLVR